MSKFTKKLRMMWLTSRTHSLSLRIKKFWYRLRYGVHVDGFGGSMYPKFGRGQFVSVHRNGPYLEITAHCDYPGVDRGKIRLIPYQPNHGFQLEFVHADGSIGNRTHLDYRQLAMLLHANVEDSGDAISDQDEELP